MALPAVVTILPKLLPAAKFAYEHRDKALTLWTEIQKRRKKQPTLTESNSPEPLSADQQIARLQKRVQQNDELLNQQSELIAQMAGDLAELSTLCNKMRIRLQWIRGVSLIAIISTIIYWIVS
ncbi:hypothetical protein [Rubritalea marina]|uniref:hypothetical protein n=1 Tax=Rubritalea marina TaxID=361055 RepID=UPI00035CDE32|nr:hypothetical protein [Rubritalea marina]